MERRGYERSNVQIDFYCYIDGHRFDSASIDISPSGVFLRTDDDVPEAARLVIVPKKEHSKDFPVMLLGMVTRKQEEPSPGLGVRWLRCVTRFGIKHIFSFMEAYPEFCARELPVVSHSMAKHSVIGYDFTGNRFYVPRRSARPPEEAELTEHELPSAPEAPASVGTPPPLTSSAEPGAITHSMRQQFEMVTVGIPVDFACAGKKYRGIIKELSLSGLFLEVDVGLLNLEGKVLINFPVPIQDDVMHARLSCSIVSSAPHATIDILGLTLSIDGVKQNRAGVFERYTKYLYYRMLASR